MDLIIRYAFFLFLQWNVDLRDQVGRVPNPQEADEKSDILTYILICRKAFVGFLILLRSIRNPTYFLLPVWVEWR